MKEERKSLPLTGRMAVLCIVCTVLFLLLNYILFQLYVERSLALQTTYIAACDIPPRTRIQEEDLLEVRIPYGYLMDHACTKKEEIIGMYTEIQGMIPAGSPFYRSMLYPEKDLPDRAAMQLRAGQTSYAMNTDVSKLGSIVSGMRADIHVTVERRGEKPLTGCLFRNVRVLSVKDHKGLELSEAGSTGIPYLIEVAVSSQDIPLLTLAETAGEIRMFPTSDSYRTDTEAELVSDSELSMYLQSLLGAQAGEE